MFKYIDHLLDTRVNCYSVILKTTISEYLNFIDAVYKDNGGIAGQRSPLKTKSAQRIRKRLIDDLIRGTVIPPIVLGVHMDDNKFTEFKSDIVTNAATIFNGLTIQEHVSIIDGMQRTTALFEAKENPNFDGKQEIRLELWVATSTNSLVYRMLVLNSGQIPWNIKRQLEVVFSQLKKELENMVEGLKLFNGDDEGSRNKAGEYQASQFIELFMLFGARRVSIDIQEELAEEFARLDIIETSGNESFMRIFLGVSQLLVNLDIAFSKLLNNSDEIELVKFKSGKHIFSSQPARAGFIVAAAQEIYGIPGIEYPEEKQIAKYDTVKQSIERFILRLQNKGEKELSEILDLATLDEQTKIRASKVGEFERTFFLKSFKTFIELLKDSPDIDLTPVWRSSH